MFFSIVHHSELNLGFDLKHHDGLWKTVMCETSFFDISLHELISNGMKVQVLYPAYSPRVCRALRRVLQLPPTVQNHLVEVN